MLFKYLSMHFKSKLQYRLSFVLVTISQFFAVGTSVIAMYSLFDRFGGIEGFTLYEALISFSVVYFGFSISQIFGRGFDKFEILIKTGTFDLLLVKPRNIYLQIMGSNIAYEKIGKTIAAFMIIIFALLKVQLQGSSWRLLMLIPMVIGSTIIFMAIFIIGASLTFYTIQNLLKCTDSIDSVVHKLSYFTSFI